MVWTKIKRLFKSSFSYFLYYKIRNFPPIRLFFDFEYTSRLWNKSFIKETSQRVVGEIISFSSLKTKRANQEIFAFLISLCPYIGALGKSYLNIILTEVVLTIYFLLSTKEENFRITVFYQSALTVIFAPFMPMFVLLYIICVETGIILFFIIKYCEDFVYEKILLYLSILWLFSLALDNKSSALTIAFMPYVIATTKKGKLRKYLYALVLLPIGFYALTFGGTYALIGGAIEIVAMIVLGDLWLIVPAVLTVPWVISFGARFIKGEVLSKNIVRTGLFFWQYGFRGINIDYNAINYSSYYGKMISIIYGVIFYLFFWYVLRISRRGVIKLFQNKEENQEILRAGIGAIVGFSVYTFLSGGNNLPYSIILYLMSGALLRRACP